MIFNYKSFCNPAPIFFRGNAVCCPPRPTGRIEGDDPLDRLLEATAETVHLPRLRRLLDYWHAQRGERRLPSRRDLDPMDFPWLLGNISLAEVVRDPAGGPTRYRLRLVGTRAAERFGYDPTGRYIDELPEPTYRERVHAAYDEVVRRGVPLVERLDMLIDDRTHDYEMLRLPLGMDGETVDMILLAADFFTADA
jgi:hypothetical protein